MARDDLDPARGIVWGALAGVAFWLVLGCAFLRAAPIDFSNVVGGVLGRDPVYAPPAAIAPPSRVRIPEAFARYRRAIEVESVRIMGVSTARPAFIAAQLHQESRYEPAARSYVGASGLGQFMPGTAQDMAKRYPAECAPADPLSPTWAIRCAILYDLELYKGAQSRAPTPLSDCTRWAFALSSYNGGAGWLARDRLLASQAGKDANRWQGNVDGYSARSKAAKKENRRYIDRIMVEIAPSYVAAGLLGPLCTDPF